MSFVSARQLRDAMAQGEVQWQGGISANSLLLELGGPLQTLVAASEPIDPHDRTSLLSLYGAVELDWDNYILQSSGFLLAQVGLPLGLSSGYFGVIATMSHLARLGLNVTQGAWLVDPGWRGYLTLEISNCAPSAVRLRSGMVVAKMLLGRVDSPDESGPDRPRLYGELGHLRSTFSEEFGERPSQGPRSDT